jgi:hypothetical protein
MTIYHLYVKTHNVTGLKYLGQTKRSDPEVYPGTGKRWVRHWKKHGKDISTVILLSTSSKAELKAAGLHYSELWNVVESNEWANLRPEDGGISDDYNTSLKMSQSQKGRKLTPEHRARLVEVNTGRKPTDATRRKLSLAASSQDRQPLSLNTKNKIGDALRENPSQTITRRNLSLMCRVLTVGRSVHRTQ